VSHRGRRRPGQDTRDRKAIEAEAAVAAARLQALKERQGR